MAVCGGRRRHLMFTRGRYVSVMPEHSDSPRPSRLPVPRRQVLAGPGGPGLLAATANSAKAATRVRRTRAAARDGTPEQIHLTWGHHPASRGAVSWAPPGQAVTARVRVGQRAGPAEP